MTRYSVLWYNSGLALEQTEHHVLKHSHGYGWKNRTRSHLHVALTGVRIGATGDGDRRCSPA